MSRNNFKITFTSTSEGLDPVDACEYLVECGIDARCVIEGAQVAIVAVGAKRTIKQALSELGEPGIKMIEVASA